MRETLHITPIFSLFVWLQSVFKDISYMVDPQNKVQVLDRDHVRSSLHFSILSLDKNPNTLTFSNLFAHLYLCVIVCLEIQAPPPSVVFILLSFTFCFSAFYFSCRVSCLKPCFIQMHNHDVTKILLFHNFILAVVLQGIFIYMCV